MAPVTALIVDVDGVISAVHPAEPAWGDEVLAGHVFGPVLVSPTLCLRLDQLGTLPGVSAAWLTSWDTKMRARMDPFPGRTWSVVAEERNVRSGQVWWKRHALETWLDAHPDVAAVAWCDDHLRSPSRRAAISRRFAARGVAVLMVAPKTAVGLSPHELACLEDWVRARVSPPERPATSPNTTEGPDE